MIDLPRKDKHGNSYLSYSQISLFKRNKKDYINQYILGHEFEGNAYTDFGSKVGEALEVNNFDKFSKIEKSVLKKVNRLDLFERKVVLNYEGFYVLGFVDTMTDDFLEMKDYKTGGQGKSYQYLQDDYTQLHLYSLAIRQETGVTPKKATVEFITRTGNAFKGEKLTVGNFNPLVLEVDISYDRLKRVYWDTLKVAKEIHDTYLFVKENFECN